MMDDIITNYHQTSNKIQLNTTLITAMIGWGDKMQILDSGSDYLKTFLLKKFFDLMQNIPS